MPKRPFALQKYQLARDSNRETDLIDNTGTACGFTESFAQ